MYDRNRSFGRSFGDFQPNCFGRSFGQNCRTTEAAKNANFCRILAIFHPFLITIIPNKSILISINQIVSKMIPNLNSNTILKLIHLEWKKDSDLKLKKRTILVELLGKGSAEASAEASVEIAEASGFGRTRV